MKDSLGEDMPCVTRKNVGEICYILTQSSNPEGPKVGGVTFIPEEDPEQPAQVKALISSPLGGYSIPLSDEQVFGALQSLKNLTDYSSRKIVFVIEKFCGTEGLEKPPHPLSITAQKTIVEKLRQS